MRCLGRLVLLVVLLIGAAGAWLYRDDIRRLVDRKLHPAAAAARIGRPSTDALRTAQAKLDALQRTRPDSVVLDAGEMASLLAQGASFLPGVAFDSISVELGDRTVRIRTLVDTASIPSRWRSLLPGRANRLEEVVVGGTLSPVHAGLAELAVQHASIHGIPLPADVIARLAIGASGRGSDGHIELVLPQTIGGFRVRSSGVAVYRVGAPK